jgi:hypothetical protein
LLYFAFAIDHWRWFRQSKGQSKAPQWKEMRQGDQPSRQLANVAAISSLNLCPENPRNPPE